MALTPNFTYEVQNIGSQIFIVDATTYGDGSINPSRAQSLVNFVITRYTSTSSEVITPSYNESSVIQIYTPLNYDGWVKMEMTITNDPEGSWGGSDYSYKKTINILVKDRLNKCVTEFGRTIFLEKPCGCECDKKLNSYYCLKAQIDCGLSELVRRNDMLSAQMSLERLSQECTLAKTNCGC